MKLAPIHLFSDIFASLTAAQRDHCALCCGGERYTYGQLAAAIDSYAGTLLDLGVRPGEHVGLWSFNSAAWVAVFFAIIKVGAVAVLPNYSLSLEEVRQMLDRAQVRVLCCGYNMALKRDPRAAEDLAAQLGLRARLDLQAPENRFDRRCAASGAPHSALAERVAADREDRAAFIIFTTGTTGAPKPVLLHQAGLLRNAAGLAQRMDGICGEAICIALPLFHVFGLQWLTTYLIQHKTVYVQDRIQAQHIIHTVSRNRITDIASVGSIYAQLTEHPDFPEIRDVLRFCQTGGGRITPSQFLKLESAFSQARFFNGLGMTEAHGGVTQPRPGDAQALRARSLGPLCDGLEGKLVDPEGRTVPTGAVGELCIRGKTLMNGYYAMPDGKSGFDPEGWFHTGDLASFEPDGCLCLAGRTKEIIIRAGENIAPLEIETAVIEAGGIQDAKVYGLPHPTLGETVECCLVPEDPASFDETALRAVLAKRLAPFKLPNRFFVFDSFPLQANGKIDDRALRQALEQRAGT